MDPEKNHTTNPLMLKKQAKEAGSSSHFSSFSQNDSAINNNVPDNFVHDNHTLVDNASDNIGTINQSKQASSYKSARQFNLRPSANPVSDFRRRQSYKGTANPFNIPRRSILNGTNPESYTYHSEPSVPKSEINNPAPIKQPANKTTPELDIDEIQTLGIPANNSNTPTENTPTQIDNPKNKKKNKKHHKKLLLIISGLLMMTSIAIIVVLVLLKFFPSHTSDTGPNDVATNNTSANHQNTNYAEPNNDSSNDDVTTPPKPSENPVTTEFIDGVVEVNIIGLADSTTSNLDHKIVKVSVSNKSDKIQSVKISLAAVDKDGKILGVSSLYSEGINPGDTNELEAFVSTSLTAEQLESAEFKIRSASTYQTKTTPSDEGQL